MTQSLIHEQEIDLYFSDQEYKLLEETAAFEKRTVEQLCSFILRMSVEGSLNGDSHLTENIWSTRMKPKNNPATTKGIKVTAKLSLTGAQLDVFSAMNQLIRKYRPDFFRDIVLDDAASAYLDYLMCEDHNVEAVRAIRAKWKKVRQH